MALARPALIEKHFPDAGVPASRFIQCWQTKEQGTQIRAFLRKEPQESGLAGEFYRAGQHLLRFIGPFLLRQGLAIDQQNFHQVSVVGVAFSRLQKSAEYFLGPLGLIQCHQHSRLANTALFKMKRIGELGIGSGTQAGPGFFQMA